MRRRIDVMIVRVARPDLRHAVRRLIEAGKIRIGPFQVHFQLNPQQARQVSEAFRPVEWVGGGLRLKDDLAGLFECSAEAAPRLSGHDLFDGVRHSGFTFNGLLKKPWTAHVLRAAASSGSSGIGLLH
jgi:hypothetical protein